MGFLDKEKHNFSFFKPLFIKTEINLGVLVSRGMKSCENCLIYFITKDAKLCNFPFFFFSFFKKKCTLIFSTLSLPIYYFCPCFACSAWSIIKPLFDLMFLSSTLYFPVKSVKVCERVYLGEREQCAEQEDKRKKLSWINDCVGWR